jgi:hypothetical protein
MTDIRIIAPANPASAVLDDQGTPFLEFGVHPQHGEGWTLWYLDDQGTAEHHCVPGGITDAGWAPTQARECLDLVRRSSDG